MALIIPADVESVKGSLDQQMVETLVAGLNAQASRVAPCIDEESPAEVIAEARLVLIGAFKRWAEAGSGAITQQQAGPFGQTIDSRSGPRGFVLWPSEIASLANLCDDGTSGDGQAFTVDMTPPAYAGGLASRPDLWFQWIHPTPPGAP